jgi:hypothetical protein
VLRIALKNGVVVTLVIAAWVALKHFGLHLEGSAAQATDVVVFNVTALLGLVLGIRERRATNGGTLTLGDGVITGSSIAVTYAVLTSLFFVMLLALVGPRLMHEQGETSYVKAFFGASFVFALSGVVLSAIVSRFLTTST